LDPLSVANEGRFIAFVPERAAADALKCLTRYPPGRAACTIGRVVDEGRGRVVLRSAIGATRILDQPAGEQLPRIC
jgi:hydrogenase expression/formation protein HypE